MTIYDFKCLQVGSVVKHAKTKKLRVVVSVGKQYTSLLKVGRSWTDPNPTAWYDNREIIKQFRFTGHEYDLRKLPKVVWDLLQRYAGQKD